MREAGSRRLLRTAVNHPCTSPRTYTYTLLVPNDEGELGEITLTATCEGPRTDNGFYGEGVVNVLRAVRR